MPETVDQETVARMLVERLRAHYGERLARVYRLDASPYPDGGNEGVHVVAVLNETSGFEALTHATNIAYAVDAEYDYAVLSNIYPISCEEFANKSSFPAVRARAEGRRL